MIGNRWVPTTEFWISNKPSDSPFWLLALHTAASWWYSLSPWCHWIVLLLKFRVKTTSKMLPCDAPKITTKLQTRIVYGRLLTSASFLRFHVACIETMDGSKCKVYKTERESLKTLMSCRLWSVIILTVSSIKYIPPPQKCLMRWNPSWWGVAKATSIANGASLMILIYFGLWSRTQHKVHHLCTVPRFAEPYKFVGTES